MDATAAAFCGNHPGRHAVGICVRCRAAVCAECVTRVDGINHCAACWSELAAKAPTHGAKRDAPRGLSYAAVGGWLVLLCLLAWALVEVAMPG